MDLEKENCGAGGRGEGGIVLHMPHSWVGWQLCHFARIWEFNHFVGLRMVINRIFHIWGWGKHSNWFKFIWPLITFHI